MNETRLNKVSRLIQKELGDHFQKNMRADYLSCMITVTVVRISPDLSSAKVYVSVFPSEQANTINKLLNDRAKTIRHDLSQRTRHQLRKVPDLQFFVDDSLDYAESIDNLLK